MRLTHLPGPPYIPQDSIFKIYIRTIESREGEKTVAVVGQRMRELSLPAFRSDHMYNFLSSEA